MTRLSPPFTEEHEELRSSIRGFLERELAPHAQRWEEEQWFPNEVFSKLAAQGLLGLKYPSEYGGQGGGYPHRSGLSEEKAPAGSGGTAAGARRPPKNPSPPDWAAGSSGQAARP